ncbi:MAG: TonB-dependent receptor [Terracidiphilus sp.]|jgi:hypothetical protein
MFKFKEILALLAAVLLFAHADRMLAQLDQGTITGIVQDPSGAVIANAVVTLTDVDEGQVFTSKTDGSGVYVFSPIKIGNYKVAATAPGFDTVTRTDLHLEIQARLNVVITLKPGAATETVTVSTEAALMQTQDSSVGQTMSTDQINNIPLSGRNWVFIAQLTPGAALPTGARGGGSGDTNVNGQRAEENNFILDGVDNNANVVDFTNGASYVVAPVPDALAEFKIQTSNYSAEFGHAAGAVINASIKSGTNNFHGSAWEYVRNNDLGEAPPPAWSTGGTVQPVPPYHQNMFGATLGGPIIKNKLFAFTDAQANRILFSQNHTLGVPSLLERTGDFSEILDLNPAGGSGNTLTGSAPVQLYQQDPTNATAPSPMPHNCMAASCTDSHGTYAGQGLALDPVALKVLSQYPKPNNANTTLYNNFSGTFPIIDNTFQWDARVDYTISAKDSAYSRYSYFNEIGSGWGGQSVLGPILDGSGQAANKNYGANYMASETHVFSPTVVNEARFGFNYLHTGFYQAGANDASLASTEGFGGIPQSPLNGGLPNSYFDGPASPNGFGAATWAPTDEHENVYQILDNLTKVAGNHSLKAGVSYQNIRFATLQPQEPRGQYDFNNRGTSQPGNGNSGYGVADFLLDQIKWSQLTNAVNDRDQRGNISLYFEDDWRIRRNVTVNLGLRYEYFQSYKEIDGQQANFFFNSKPTLNITTSGGVETGATPSVTGTYTVPAISAAATYATMQLNGFNTALSKDGLSIVTDQNPRLQTAPLINLAPRVGVSWSLDPKTVVRAGYGIFYGGLESLGYWGNLGENYPFQVNGSWDSPSCLSNFCPQPSQPVGAWSSGSLMAQDITIENGFNHILSQPAGIDSVVTGLTMRGTDPKAKSTYTQDYNLSVERAITKDFVGTVSYLGDNSHHLELEDDVNAQLALINGSGNGQAVRPMPDYGGSAYTQYEGMSDYNSLQAKLEKRMSRGYNLLASYTWSHSLDNTPTPLGSSGYDTGNVIQTNLVPFKYDYSNSPWDVRQRFTFTGLYQLPFGKGRQFLNNNAVADAIVGGWSVNPTFTAQTGEHFNVGTNSFSGANGFASGPFAKKIANEYAAGGSSPNCATKVKTLSAWYNPCSYSNPWDASDAYVTINPNGSPTGGGTTPNPHYIPNGANDPNTPPGDTTPVYVTDLASVLGYAGGPRTNAAGPGFERVNASIFKDFSVFREQKLTFRADIFNVMNTPAWGEPGGNNGSNGAQITSTRGGLAKDTPDERFFQLSLKYAF